MGKVVNNRLAVPVRCRNPACSHFCRQIRDRPYCNTCAIRQRYRGSLAVPCLTIREKHPYIKAALFYAKKKSSQVSRAEIETLLLSCRSFNRKQADLHRCGWTAKEKARCVLAILYRQRSVARKKRYAPTAAALLLASCAGTMAMRMETSSPRYTKMQVARSIVHLLKAEWFTWQGKRTRQRFRLQSWHVAQALYEALKPYVFYWLERHRAAIVQRSAIYKPLPSSQKRNHHV